MRIGILTNFHEFIPGYSLTGIVTDQVAMLLRHGHEVHLYISEEHDDRYDYLLPSDENLHSHHTVPNMPLTDYQSTGELSEQGQKYVKRLTTWLTATMKADKIEACFTHDMIFTGWNLPFALAIQNTNRALKDISFLHWIHSVPGDFKDWWDFERYGPNHRIISPTAANRDLVAEQYRTTSKRVSVIHHIKDPRTWFEFSEETRSFIDDHPGVMQADVVGIYPASCDRLDAKQVAMVMALFAAFKRRCLTTCFICANQHASRYTHAQSLDEYYEIADELNLTTIRNRPDDCYAEEFIFTSEWQHPTYEQGIPRHMLRELMLLSNIFVFPTREESFGLVAPEAALCGNFMVLNEDLDNQAEIFCRQGTYCHWGSFRRGFEPEDWAVYLDATAGKLLGKMRQDEVAMTRSYTRQNLNMDKLYFTAYEPVIQELRSCNA